jgi:hypothetical protein
MLQTYIKKQNHNVKVSLFFAVSAARIRSGHVSGKKKYVPARTYGTNKHSFSGLNSR